MKIFILTNLLALLICIHASPEVHLEPTVSFPVVGSHFQVSCLADGRADKKTPAVRFIDGFNLELTNTTTRSVYRIVQPSNYTVEVVMVWKNISLQDMSTVAEGRSSCEVDATAHSFRMFVLPKYGKPRFLVSPRLPITGMRGKDISFDCNVATDIMEKVTGMSVSWKTGNESYLVPISRNKTKIETREITRGVSLMLESRLTITDLNDTDVGLYFCVANLKVNTSSGNTARSRDLFRRVVELKAVTSPPKPSSSIQNVSNVFFSCCMLLLTTVATIFSREDFLM